ncbi:MAG: glycosyltransferase family 2 protein [Edaphobacter sp.]|uniref:glycosyltransferase family 2 protein n=1 Tax=Edaphobacter sp. TaxID=1934404 RepID=UPI0023971F6A|nr:glycosyltransferase family 2 protein [Edaphobacter sp.]MDE1176233.1 glycosyltransferase family 2 protein [Edaphobacter sp.]
MFVAPDSRQDDLKTETVYNSHPITERPRLSVAIITLNEEQNLPRTLASVQFADEVIVVDSGSTDRTLEIAREYGATVIFEPWKGFAQQKNSAIEKCTGEWVLSLDADEELTPELQREIAMLLKGTPDADAYMLRRRNLFLGRWMRYGGYYPDPKLRLFRKYSANFAPSARFTERPVHETMAFEGRLETLEHDLIHHAYPTIESYIEHMDRYSTLGAQILLEKGKTGRSLYAFIHNIFVIPSFTFLWNFVFRGGFRDGREGLLLHLYHSTYTSWKYSKAWQIARRR